MKSLSVLSVSSVMMIYVIGPATRCLEIWQDCITGPDVSFSCFLMKWTFVPNQFSINACMWNAATLLNLHIPSPQPEPRNPNTTNPPSLLPRLHSDPYRLQIHHVYCAKGSHADQWPPLRAIALPNHLRLAQVLQDLKGGAPRRALYGVSWRTPSKISILVPKRGALRFWVAIHLAETICAAFIISADRYRRTMNWWVDLWRKMSSVLKDMTRAGLKKGRLCYIS